MREAVHREWVAARLEEIVDATYSKLRQRYVVVVEDAQPQGDARLHGFGFEGALREVGLPESDIPLALLTFNVGVELGQLMFVATVLLALAALRSFVSRLPAWAHAVSAYGIGAMAAFWWLQRMAPLF